MRKTTDIRKVHNAQDLIGYFAGKLGWNIDVESFDTVEDFSYEFTAEDLGITEESFAKIRTLRQLRPFDAHQKWGLFCIEFDSSRFEVSALRKILSGLIPRRRKDPNAPVWNQQDILFLCDWGDETNRTIGLAHFEEHEKGLPQIKTISCTPSSSLADPAELKTFESRLAGLAWPKDTSNWREWSAEWSRAFTTQYRETIRRSSELTQKLAAEARDIRDRILATMSVESKNGYVHLLWGKFKATLIADMSQEQFADMYAQTMVYGLFSARCMDKTPEDFSVEEAIACIPNTNPFLKSLMKDCMRVTGKKGVLSFDELEIGNVVDLLLHTDMTEIVKDFNRQSGEGREDPVIHFYEEFLTAYDKALKIQCGVFYTPQPVVNFIVRAVDSILKKDFGYADGLATTATRHIGRGKGKDIPAVQILDPATGTGTFLRQTILQIHENFKAAHKGESPEAVRKAWNAYVPKHLLPRLNGFELMMAPYAVAHMKLAMVLKDTGYDFESSKRLGVYLTNSLEVAGSTDAQQTFWDDPIAAESIDANKAKVNPGINVVIGNPPYSGISQNNGAWITKLVDQYKYTDGEYFNERKHWLNDDYVKFIRLGQSFAATGDSGILAYINNHSFIDNPTFRAMRWNLLHVFDEIYILDLHGSTKKKVNPSICPKDENVFDIQQGVSINIFVKKFGSSKKKLGTIYHADLYGTRDYKNGQLSKLSIEDIAWLKVDYTAPYYLFVQREESFRDEWEGFENVRSIFPVTSTGIVTARDDLVVDMEKKELLKRISLFADPGLTDEEIRRQFYPNKKEGKYLPGDTRGWKLHSARTLICDNDHTSIVKDVLYRLFDVRSIYYSVDMVDWGRENLMSNFLGHDNYGLLCCRQLAENDWYHVFVTDRIVDDCCVSNKTKERGYVFPLYLYSEEMGKTVKRPNLDAKIVAQIEKTVGKTTPEDIFHYIYAVLHTREYREKYKEFLKIDFPRIPYPKNAKTFRALVEKGEALVATHLLKSDAVTREVKGSDVAVFKGRTALVEKPRYEAGTVYLNKTQAFENVPETAWNFYIGGYQSAQKWLKDRKGRTLVEADISHYRQIIHALLETNRLMDELSELSSQWMA